MSRTVRACSNERGAAAVEFALVVPLLLALVFGIIDFGWAINRNALVNNATREAVRVASLGGSVAEINAAVTASLDGLSDAPTVTVTCTKVDGGSCGSYASDAGPGGTAIITVVSTHDWLTPMGSTFSDQLTLTKTSRMRIE